MIDEATKAAILEKFPGAKTLTAQYGEEEAPQVAEIIVKVPGRAEYRRFKTLGLDERRRVDAGETLLRDCCLSPDAKGLADLLERAPALAETFSGKLLELAGMAQEVAARDLSSA